MNKRLYRVWGINLSDIIIRAIDAEKALSIAREIDTNYSAVQPVDELVKKIYNIDVKEDPIIE